MGEKGPRTEDAKDAEVFFNLDSEVRENRSRARRRPRCFATFCRMNGSIVLQLFVPLVSVPNIQISRGRARRLGRETLLNFGFWDKQKI
jgi:hypothetical protein